MAKVPHRRDIARRFAILAAMLVVAIVWMPRHAAAQAARESVRLVVDYGDGSSKTIANLPWSKGVTILDAMKAATARPHGISFSYTGSGETAMLTKIDDVQNEGGGAAKKNWQYWVNDSYGDRSFVTFELRAADVIVWRFATEAKEGK